MATASPSTPAIAKAVITIPVTPVVGQPPQEVAVRTGKRKTNRFAAWQWSVDFAHQYSAGVFAILLLGIGISGVNVASNYRTAQIAASVPVNYHVTRPAQPKSGINMAVPAEKLVSTLQTITAQSFTVPMGDRVTSLDTSMVKDMLQVVTDRTTHTAYIHVNEAAISTRLQAIAQEYSKAAVSQVSVDHGAGPQIIAPGKNGLQVSVPDGLAKEVAKNLLGAKGIQATLNAAPLAFQVVTPAVFTKMIEVNVVTKQMYLYENGNIYKSYAISAGKPTTPTPIGQFKIFSKLAVQDMKGFNPDGTPYFQPHVHWINYFLPGGFAIHGVYWHPQTWFGANNSSHGCVGLPDDQAAEVFNWAPVGTPVITHA